MTRQPGGRGLRGFLARLARALGARLYAVALIAIIVYVSYRAVAYLVVSLMTPDRAPEQIVGIARELDARLLQPDAPPLLGRIAVDTPRTPPSHYHRIDTTYVADRFNDCTRSGCHVPLPHAVHKEERAFLNMHATSLHCGVCHFVSGDRPLRLTWYDLADGRAAPPPPLLQAYGWLTAQRPDAAATYTVAQQQQIVGLLRDAAAAVGGERALEHLAAAAAAVRADGPQFADVIAAARETVPRYFRGAYGSKLALLDPATGRPVLGHPGAEAANRKLLAEYAGADAAARAELVRAAHPWKRTAPLSCTACHSPEEKLIDHAALGYPAERIRALSAPAVFQMIQRIRSGEPFYLPSFVDPRTAPTSGPTNP